MTGLNEVLGMFACLLPILALVAYMAWATRRRQCPHCHHAISPGESTCAHCGNPLDEEQQRIVPVADRHSTHHESIGGLIGGAVRSCNVIQRIKNGSMTRFLCDTHVGRIHHENQDRAIARTIVGAEDLSLIAVADGISSCPFGGSVANWVINEHVAIDSIELAAGVSQESQLRDYLEGLSTEFRKSWADFPEMLMSGCCLSLATHYRGETHCFWVGDSPIFSTAVIDGQYTTEQVSTPDSPGGSVINDWFGGTSRFRLKHIRLSSPCSIVTITSDGAKYDAPMLSTAYQQLGFCDRLSEEIVREALLDPHADDVSISAMQLDAASQ